MIPQFEKLSREEAELLLKAPALISVMASCSDRNINKKQRADAIKLAHIKTFTAIPVLQPFYREVEKEFTNQFDRIAEKYFPFDEKKRNELKEEISKVQVVIGKLDISFGSSLSKSFERYAGHVKRATHTIYQDFAFPIYLFGLTDI